MNYRFIGVLTVSAAFVFAVNVFAQQRPADVPVMSIPAVGEEGESNATGRIASSIIKGVGKSKQIKGKATIIEGADGVFVHAIITGVRRAGNHGIHIHENGSCDNEGAAAGGHYNPDRKKHGFLPVDGLKNAHAGDMGNITIQADGSGILAVFLPGLNISKGRYNVVGKSIILHEKADDFSQPTGNAGARIACGIIELAIQ